MSENMSSHPIPVDLEPDQETRVETTTVDLHPHDNTPELDDALAQVEKTLKALEIAPDKK
jgi:hypothetical protein